MRTMGGNELVCYSCVCIHRMERPLGKKEEARNGVGKDQNIEGLKCRLKEFEFYSADQYKMDFTRSLSSKAESKEGTWYAKKIKKN